MIAVVYSGSRNANWKLAEKGKIISEFKTPGINPFFNDESHITQFLNKNAELINNAEKIHWVYFFGAGASSKERQEIVTKALASCCTCRLWRRKGYNWHFRKWLKCSLF